MGACTVVTVPIAEMRFKQALFGPNPDLSVPMTKKTTAMASCGHPLRGFYCVADRSCGKARSAGKRRAASYNP